MVLAIFYTGLFVTLTTLPLIYYHYELHGISYLQASLALFCSINVMICWWEMGLFLNRGLIKTQYNAFKKRLKKNELPSPMFLFDHVTLSQAVSLEYWALVWSTYSLIDPSYADQTTFGFFVDVGNGFTTIIPSVIFAVSMTWPFMSARILGVMGLIKFYQEMYGTIIYFFSFVLNQRYSGKPAAQIYIVIISNSLWIVFPVLGLYASYILVDRNDYSVFFS
ncbi:hypothetical protein CEUSTIGMA_g9602.t1 [Chlamydomonas eustigma]|uniref:EXPERA domain-containing protein n=1 Tax=Chlamydomonas eustigma TaxID=1157962 RepID=A0A250XGH0_9CHLO|nr:hypothetical protein CEUSTIGMA_g9602.t1 [Chlamydomonas eustigma]|eukprot:GAX82174.1 hypothetical protein CEUSTIGMA_g9602.t1 [Chlamydomonas eustigma]